jgi:membrane protease YdiL (CAAX protease family)
MKKISRFADRRPLLFVLLALLAWLVLGAFIMGGIVFLLKAPISNPFVQLASTVGATGVLLWLAFRLGWIRRIGITHAGTLRTWAVTLVLVLYVILTGFYTYFGDITFRVGSLVDTPEARSLLFRMPLVGFVEETVFRGILLYALVRVWGKTKRGLVAAVLVQAALFGALHVTQVVAGTTLAAALANALGCFVFGIWLGALVLSVRSLWPAIVLHTASNAFILIKGLSSPWVDPISLAYLRGALLDLPLVLLGLWIILKVRHTRAAAPVVPRSPAAQH